MHKLFIIHITLFKPIYIICSPAAIRLVHVSLSDSNQYDMSLASSFGVHSIFSSFHTSKNLGYNIINQPDALHLFLCSQNSFFCDI